MEGAVVVTGSGSGSGAAERDEPGVPAAENPIWRYVETHFHENQSTVLPVVSRLPHHAAYWRIMDEMLDDAPATITEYARDHCGGYAKGGAAADTAFVALLIVDHPDPGPVGGPPASRGRARVVRLATLAALLTESLQTADGAWAEWRAGVVHAEMIPGFVRAAANMLPQTLFLQSFGALQTNPWGLGYDMQVFSHAHHGLCSRLSVMTHRAGDLLAGRDRLPSRHVAAWMLLVAVGDMLSAGDPAAEDAIQTMADMFRLDARLTVYANRAGRLLAALRRGEHSHALRNLVTNTPLLCEALLAAVDCTTRAPPPRPPQPLPQPEVLPPEREHFAVDAAVVIDRIDVSGTRVRREEVMQAILTAVDDPRAETMEQGLDPDCEYEFLETTDAAFCSSGGLTGELSMLLADSARDRSMRHTRTVFNGTHLHLAPRTAIGVNFVLRTALAALTPGGLRPERGHSLLVAPLLATAAHYDEGGVADMAGVMAYMLTGGSISTARRVRAFAAETPTSVRRMVYLATAKLSAALDAQISLPVHVVQQALVMAAVGSGTRLAATLGEECDRYVERAVDYGFERRDVLPLLRRAMGAKGNEAAMLVFTLANLLLVPDTDPMHCTPARFCSVAAALMHNLISVPNPGEVPPRNCEQDLELVQSIAQNSLPLPCPTANVCGPAGGEAYGNNWFPNRWRVMPQPLGSEDESVAVLRLLLYLEIVYRGFKIDVGVERHESLFRSQIRAGKPCLLHPVFRLYGGTRPLQPGTEKAVADGGGGRQTTLVFHNECVLRAHDGSMDDPPSTLSEIEWRLSRGLPAVAAPWYGVSRTVAHLYLLEHAGRSPAALYEGDAADLLQKEMAYHAANRTIGGVSLVDVAAQRAVPAGEYAEVDPASVAGDEDGGGDEPPVFDVDSLFYFDEQPLPAADMNPDNMI